jgi:hypothetical protein
MASQPPIPSRVILLNAALVLVWVPLIFLARSLIETVISRDPSDDLLLGARLAVIGTLFIITVVYLFAIVLINKFMTQNLGDTQRRVVRPTLIAAVLLYIAAGVVAFA